MNNASFNRELFNDTIKKRVFYMIGERLIPSKRVNYPSSIKVENQESKRVNFPSSGKAGYQKSKRVNYPEANKLI